MISPFKFRALNIRQQIYKFASALRQMEDALKQGDPASLRSLQTYRGYLHGEHPPKIQAALGVVDPLLDALPRMRPREAEAACNHAYYALLAMYDEPPRETQFHVRHFDRNQPEHAPLPLVGILDNLRSPFNVGAIFRTAEAFGVMELALCGITLRPPHPKLARTAMGTETHVAWHGFDTCVDAIRFYREQGFRILGFESLDLASQDPLGQDPLGQDPQNSGLRVRAYSLENLDPLLVEPGVAAVFGNEEFGMDEAALDLVDACVSIPLLGRKNSINVGHAFAVCAYKALEQSLRTR